MRGFNNIITSNGNAIAGKFGYNGKELSEELGLNWSGFGARNYDAALGRWMNLDPLAEQYTNITPYAFVANMPTIAIDPDGKRIIIIGSGKYRKQILSALLEMASTDKGLEIFKQMVGSKDDIIIGNFIGEGKNKFLGGKKGKNKNSYYVHINPNDTQPLDGGVPKTLGTSVAHEMGHVKDIMDDGSLNLTLVTTKEGAKNNKAFYATELGNVHRENIIRSGLDYKLRDTYVGVRVRDMKRTDNTLSFGDPDAPNTAQEIVPKAENMFFNYSSVPKASLSNIIGALKIIAGGFSTTNNVNQFKSKRFNIKAKTASVIKKQKGEK